MTQATGADENSASGAITFTTTYQYYDARGMIDAAGKGNFEISLQDVTSPARTVFQYQYQYDAGANSAFGDANGTPGTLISGSLTGALTPGDTYIYTYTYDSTGPGTVNLDLGLSVPLPNPAYAGAIILAAFAIYRVRRVLPA